jgi:hypothetical protein
VAIYEVVDDPENAPLSVADLLVGGMSLKHSKEVAQARRGMKSEMLVMLSRIGTLKRIGLECKTS